MGDYAERAGGHDLLLASLSRAAKKIRAGLGTPYFSACSWTYERSFVWLPPQPLKPYRIGGRVPDGVLNVPVSQVVLNQPR
jgi:hypothetical protein